MPVNRAIGLSLGAAILLCSSSLHLAYAKPFMIVGNDEKFSWDDDGKTVLSAPGKDTVLIVDLADPESPKIVATLPLKNSIVGPPVNLDIDPSGSVALVADSIDVTKDGDTLKQGPDNKLYVIDLKAESAQAGGDLHPRQAAVGTEHQPVRQDGAGRQSRRQLDQRALDQRHRRQGHRYRRDARQRLACAVHPGRQAGAGGAIPGVTRCRCSISPATR